MSGHMTFSFVCVEGGFKSRSHISICKVICKHVCVNWYYLKLSVWLVPFSEKNNCVHGW